MVKIEDDNIEMNGYNYEVMSETMTLLLAIIEMVRQENKDDALHYVKDIGYLLKCATESILKDESVMRGGLNGVKEIYKEMGIDF